MSSERPRRISSASLLPPSSKGNVRLRLIPSTSPRRNRGFRTDRRKRRGRCRCFRCRRDFRCPPTSRRQHGRQRPNLSPLEIVVRDYLPVIHPSHQCEVRADRTQLLSLSEVVVRHVAEHLVPRESRVVFWFLGVLVFAEEAGG